jgi:hypothetical protein
MNASSAEIAAIHIRVSAEIDPALRALKNLRKEFDGVASDAQQVGASTANDLRRISNAAKSEFAGTANAAKTLGNELRGAVGNFKAAGGDAEAFATKLERIRTEALQAADGLDQTSTEYVQLQSVAARATTEIDRNARAMEQAAQKARGLQLAQQQANREALHGAPTAATAAPSGAGGGIAGMVGGAVGGAIAAYGVREVVEFGAEMTRTGDQIRRTDSALRAYSNNAQADMQAVLRGARGMATEFEATQTAAVLLKNRIATNSTELEKFSRVASVLGSQTGLSPAEYINELNSAFANSSWDRLDQLGLVSSNVRAEVERLKESGMGMQEAFRLAVLKDAETQLRALEAAGYDGSSALGALSVAGRDFYDGVAESLSSGIAGITTQLGALAEAAGLPAVNFRDLGNSVAETITQMTGLDRLQQDAQALSVIAQNVRSYTDDINVHNQAAALMAETEARVADQLNAIPLEDTAAQTRLVAAAFLEAGREAGFSQSEIVQLWIALDGTRAELGFVEPKAYAASDAIRDIGVSAAWSASQVWAFKDALDAAEGRQMGGRSSTAGIPTELFQERRAQEYGDTTGYNDFYQDPNRKAFVLDQQQRAFAREAREKLEAERAALGTGTRTGSTRTGKSEEERAAEKALKDWESKVEKSVQNVRSAVTGAFDTSITVSQDDLILAAAGQYKEKFAENARRLQSVVENGSQSEWADDFFGNALGLSEESLKASAVTLRNDIQDFLRPELLNIDAAMEEARRTLIGNANKEKMAEELTRRLIGEGFGEVASESAAADIFGIKGNGAAALGLDGATVATDFTASMVKTMLMEVQSNEAQFIELGRLMREGILKGGTETGSAIVQGVASEAMEYIADWIEGMNP